VIRLHNRDCFKVPGWGSPPCVLVTDPPYGVAYLSNRGDRPAWAGKRIVGDESQESRDRAMAYFAPVVGAWAVFGSLRCVAPNGTRGILVWDKGPSSGMGDLSFPWKPSAELVFVGGDGWSGRRDGCVLAVFQPPTQSMGRTHPTEKPVALLEAIIAKAPPGVIVDPFMGTGSTGIAAVRQGRDFIGAEIDPVYFSIAEERIGAAQAQGDLFAARERRA